MLSSFPKIPVWASGANPGALHKEAAALKRVLLGAREVASRGVGAQKDEIIFTSGATESDNLAVFGFLKNQIEQGIDPKEIAVYVSSFEHSAIEESVKNIYKGIKIYKLPQEGGYVLPNSLSIEEGVKVALVSIIFVQNEIGTVQDIKEIAKRLRKLRKENPEKTIVFHTDATQAPLYYDLNVLRLGVDMMTLGATKLYCPKGVGMLFKKRAIKLSPIIYGGGQELGLRPGTEPVELIHKFAHALSYAQAQYERAHNETLELQMYFENKVKKEFPQIVVTGGGERSPHITHLVVPNIDSELLVLEFDARGIAVSSKSACKNDQDQDSGIMNLLYPNQNLGAVRISYGRKTTKRELNKTIKALGEVFKKYKLN
jgi:cysteine desulfurase